MHSQFVVILERHRVSLMDVVTIRKKSVNQSMKSIDFFLVKIPEMNYPSSLFVMVVVVVD